MCLAHILRLFVLLLFLVACSRHNHPSEHIGIPVDQEQQALVLQKMEELREQWNSGACEAVYNQAAPAFRSQLLSEWLSQCEYLREKLGIWQRFSFQEATTYGKSAESPTWMCLEGTALLGKENYDIAIGWIIKNRDLRLFYLSLARNGKAIQTIPPPPQHLLDPPLSTPVKRGLNNSISFFEALTNPA